MTTRLEAWLEDRHAGQFVIDDDGSGDHADATRFEYDPDAPATPISQAS